MFCRLCGKQVEDGQEFCEDCQEELKKAAQKAAEKARMTCPHCGKETSATEKFCEHCDGYLKNTQKPAPQTPTILSQPKKQQTPPPSPAARATTKSCATCKQIIPINAIYCPVCKRLADVPPVTTPTPDEGSYGVGIVLALFLGWVGLIIAYAIGKKETTSGAWTGIVINLLIAGVALIIGMPYYCN